MLKIIKLQGNVIDFPRRDVITAALTTQTSWRRWNLKGSAFNRRAAKGCDG